MEESPAYNQALGEQNGKEDANMGTKMIHLFVWKGRSKYRKPIVITRHFPTAFVIKNYAYYYDDHYDI